jgi:hypothetical protein
MTPVLPNRGMGLFLKGDISKKDTTEVGSGQGFRVYSSTLIICDVVHKARNFGHILLGL